MDKWSVVVDKSPGLEMLKNVIGSGALGSWQSIQIVCRLQESVREDICTCRMDRAHCEKPHISKLVSIYPNHEYHYFSLY